MHSIVGWTTVITSWARIEGIPTFINAPTVLLNSLENKTSQIDRFQGERVSKDTLTVGTSSLTPSQLLNDPDSEGLYHRETEGTPCHEYLRVLSDGITVLGAGVYVEPEVHLRNCVVLPNISVKESAFHQIII